MVRFLDHFHSHAFSCLLSFKSLKVLLQLELPLLAHFVQHTQSLIRPLYHFTSLNHFALVSVRLTQAGFTRLNLIEALAAVADRRVPALVRHVEITAVLALVRCAVTVGSHSRQVTSHMTR